MYEKNLNELEQCFKLALKEQCNYVAVKVRMNNFEKDEVIINHIENTVSKLEYYKKAYNEDLQLNNAPNAIQIVDFTYGNSYEEIEWFFKIKEEML